MAKKPAPKKASAKKNVPAKKKTVAKPKKSPAKKTPSAKKPAPKKIPAKKPALAKKPVIATKAKAAPSAVAKKIEPAPVLKPVFEAPSVKPVAPPTAPKVVMKTGGGAAVSLTISAQAAAGNAANGNSHPANIMVLVSCGGWPVTDLTKDHFTLMEYFEVPGQQAPFSNNITSFRNVGTGAYLLQVKPINGAPWRSGHHIAQILVSSADDRQGQAGVKLIIR